VSPLFSTFSKSHFCFSKKLGDQFRKLRFTEWRRMRFFNSNLIPPPRLLQKPPLEGPAVNLQSYSVSAPRKLRFTECRRMLFFNRNFALAVRGSAKIASGQTCNQAAEPEGQHVPQVAIHRIAQNAFFQSQVGFRRQGPRTAINFQYHG
jgi:hypothetical protein